MSEFLSEDVDPFAGLGVVAVDAASSVAAGIVRIVDDAVDDR